MRRRVDVSAAVGPTIDGRDIRWIALLERKPLPNINSGIARIRGRPRRDGNTHVINAHWCIVPLPSWSRGIVAQLVHPALQTRPCCEAARQYASIKRNHSKLSGENH